MKIKYFLTILSILLVSCVSEPEPDPAVLENAPIIEELETLPDDVVTNMLSSKYYINFEMNCLIISPII